MEEYALFMGWKLLRWQYYDIKFHQIYFYMQ